MNRIVRLITVVVVVVAMGIVTWMAHNHYWRCKHYRTVSTGVLYVVHDLDEDLFIRFRSHFGELNLIDVRSDVEMGAANGEPDLPTVERKSLALVRRLPLPPDRVPDGQEVLAFLKICADPGNRPVVLFAGLIPDEALDIRLACLEAAYRHLVLRQPLESSLSDTAIVGTVHEAGCRNLLKTLSNM